MRGTIAAARPTSICYFVAAIQPAISPPISLRKARGTIPESNRAESEWLAVILIAAEKEDVHARRVMELLHEMGNPVPLIHGTEFGITRTLSFCPGTGDGASAIAMALGSAQTISPRSGTGAQVARGRIMSSPINSTVRSRNQSGSMRLTASSLCCTPGS